MHAVLAVLAVLAGAGATPQCEISLRVTRLEMRAPWVQPREKVIAEPRVVTTFGRPAYFRIGTPDTGVNGITGPGVCRLVGGVEIGVLPLEGSGDRVRLEMEVTPTGASGSRFALDLKWELKNHARVKAGDSRGPVRVEVTVTRVGSGK